MSLPAIRQGQTSLLYSSLSGKQLVKISNRTAQEVHQRDEMVAKVKTELQVNKANAKPLFNV
jgi:hypothetical protein